MREIAAFRKTVCSHRDDYSRPLVSLNCRQAANGSVSLVPCALLAPVSIFMAIMPITKLTLLLLLFLALDIGVAMLLSRDYCMYQRTKLTSVTTT